MVRFGNSGFSLIEVLIAILLLAGGVMGAAGMQLTALRTTQQSSFHTAAFQLASEMADRMRANDSQMKLDDSDNPYLAVDYYSAADAEPSVPHVLCYELSCDGEELAIFDIYTWQMRIRAALPGGRAVICRDDEPWQPGRTLRWECSGDAESGLPIVVKLGWHAKNPDGSSAADAAGSDVPAVALIVVPYTR